MNAKRDADAIEPKAGEQPTKEPANAGAPTARAWRPFLVWRDEFEVGVQIIDDQHRTLVELVNELGDDLVAGRDRDEVLGSLRALIRFTAEHFATEERLMSEHGGGPGEEHHRAEHRRLFDEVRALTLDEESTEADAAAVTMRFLRDWLLRHIEVEDRPLSDWLRRHGVD